MLVEELTEEECFAALSRTRLARLACARENQPNIVPVYVVCDRLNPGSFVVYGWTTAGQKVEWMRTNPLVCLEWDEVESYDRWWSIVAVGRYEELLDVEATRNERLKAYGLLSKYLMWWQPGAASYVADIEHHATQPYRPIYYRILIDRITGRRAIPDSRSTAST
jgi:nitroimidazol reductase NimA-like FMN-containing flavoprotein (pyridoxamine 5'-phosphate oxidase superfamily)